VTLPLIHTLRKCTPGERRKLESVFFSDTIEHHDFVRVVEMIDKYGAIGYTIDRAKNFVKQAKDCLVNFDPCDAKTAILALADYVVERRS